MVGFAAAHGPLFVKDRYVVEDFRRTISLIQIGAKGEVHPLETG